ncbi:ribose 5-phosphate isomerase B [bacterium]|nr:ribose 5-phosphate isomerase B [bacterium]
MSKPQPIFIGGDHAGFETKKSIVEFLKKEFPAHVVEDCGTHSSASTHYPLHAEAVAKKVVASGGLGVLVCGSGIGVAIAANKVPGVRATVVWNSTSARLCRQHNDANIVCFGARLLGPEVIQDSLRAFLTATFEQGRHAERVELIRKMES